jgi:diaminopimelate epimerase
MNPITFFKASGSGNDFIIIDNRHKIVDEKDLSNFIASVCRRKLSVGADGFILIEDSDTVDFKWRFYNSDGSRVEMCGNGARCAARFAYINGIAGPRMSFETDAGIISAQITDNRVKIKMTNPLDLRIDYTIELKDVPLTVSSINTGVPHVVITVQDIDRVDVLGLGREIRFHDMYAPAGTNVNFISFRNDGILINRTYERGVEDETLACGTGSVAAALVMAYKSGKLPPIDVLTKSGEYLTVHFTKENGKFYDVHLEGNARIIYKGELWKDAYM